MTTNTDKPIYINQTRTGSFSGNSVLYTITTIVEKNLTYAANVKDSDFLLNLFVVNIVDADDPSQDTFSNYATLADLDLIAADREAAVLAGSSKYRDNTNTITFNNLSVATTAAQVVRDTINNIVDTYLKVKDTFLGSSTHYMPYPQETTSLRDQYIQAYTASRDARILAEDNQEEAQLDYNFAELEKNLRDEFKTTICDLKDKLASMQSLVHVVGTKYKQTVLDLIDAADGQTGVTNIATLRTWIDDNFIDQGLVSDSSFIDSVDTTSGSGLSLLALILQASTSAQTSCHLAGIHLTGATTDVANRLSELKEKQQLKEAAASVEESNLATLTTYCPDLDPSSL